jgi:hypothetical protein
MKMIPKTTRQIDRAMQLADDRAEAVRKEIGEISDYTLLLFQDWVMNNEIANITEFIEAKAYDQSLEPESF